MSARFRCTAAVLALGVVAILSTAVTGCGGSGSGSSSSSSTLVFSPDTAIVLSATAGPLAPGALPYNQTFSVVSGGTPPFTFVATTTPPGLALAAAAVNPGLVGTLSATLSGTPSQQGLETFAMTVTDANGHSYNASWTIEVGMATPALSVTPATLPSATRGQPYNQFLTASGGITPFSWTVTTGPLPPGISTNPSTGVTFELTGMATTAGTFPFTITVHDGSNPPRTAVLSLSLTVN